MNNVIPIHYKGLAIRFTGEGWINATGAAKHFGKEPYAWLISPDTLRYLVALAEAIGFESNPLIFQELNEINELDSGKPATKARILRAIKMTGLVRVKGGSPENGGGTWLHPKLAVFFARWCSIDFAVWCDLHIDALLRGELSEKQQLDRACRLYDERSQKASQAGRDLAGWKHDKSGLAHQVDYWREQLQLTLGLDVA